MDAEVVWLVVPGLALDSLTLPPAASGGGNADGARPTAAGRAASGLEGGTVECPDAILLVVPAGALDATLTLRFARGVAVAPAHSDGPSLARRPTRSRDASVVLCPLRVDGTRRPPVRSHDRSGGLWQA